MKISSISFYGNPVKKPISSMASNILSSAPPNIITPSVNSAGGSAKGALNEFEINNINEVKELFELAHSSIKAIAKSCNTRNAVKNGYSKLKKGVAGSRILEFSRLLEDNYDCIS